MTRINRPQSFTYPLKKLSRGIMKEQKLMMVIFPIRILINFSKISIYEHGNHYILHNLNVLIRRTSRDTSSTLANI